MQPQTINWYYSHPNMKFENSGSGMYFVYEEDVDCQSNHFNVPASPDDPKWQQIDEKIQEKEAEVLFWAQKLFTSLF